MPRWRSFRTRLTLWNLLIMALALSGYVVLQGFIIRRNLDAATDRDLWNRAHRFAGWWAQRDPRLLPAIRTGDFGWPGSPRDRRRPLPTPGVPPSPLSGSPTSRRGFYSLPRVLGVDGEPLVPFSSETPWDNEAFIVALADRETYTTTTYEQDTVRVFSLPLKRQFGDIATIEGVVQVAHPLTEQHRLADSLIRTPLTLIPLALGLAGLGAVFLAGRALRPVRSLTQAAAEIGEHDLSRRLEVTGNDELAELASTFNGMIGRLETAFEGRREAIERLEAAYDQQRRFAGDASHELRTPLTRIKACASLALSRERSAADYTQALATINRAADEMQRLVDDLLLLARADAGRLEQELGPVDLGRILAEAAVQTPEGAPIRIEAPAEAAAIPGDAGALCRLFRNLLENARRHTPAGGEITARVLHLNGAAEIEIRDNGEGIPPEHLPHLGERFYRVDAARSRRQGGTGLGLAICRSIAAAHQGSLRIESTPGEGTTVVVTLPTPPAVDGLERVAEVDGR